MVLKTRRPDWRESDQIRGRAAAVKPAVGQIAGNIHIYRFTVESGMSRSWNIVVMKYSEASAASILIFILDTVVVMVEIEQTDVQLGARREVTITSQLPKLQETLLTPFATEGETRATLTSEINL